MPVWQRPQMQQLGLWGGFTTPPGPSHETVGPPALHCQEPQEISMKNRAFKGKKSEVAVLAEVCLALLDLHMNQVDETKETDAVNLEDAYNELKPQLEALLRRAHGETTFTTVSK